jgi:hypothetical protein
MVDASSAMWSSADEPIDGAEQDRLSRNGFSRQLAKAIAGWAGRQSLTVAVTGVWGSGKSSIKNMERVLADAEKKNALDDDGGDDKKPKPWSSHWWEQYTVRYFIGTIIGVFVVFILRSHGPLKDEVAKLIPDLLKIDGKKLAAVGALGLAFCYVASAPILTLHAVRGSLSVDHCGFNLGLLGFVVSPLLITYGADYIGINCVRIASLGIIVGGQCVLIVISSLERFKKLKAFYDDLIEARLYDWSTKRDYVDSYRHLREHGNALAIVLCELALAAFLATAHDAREALVVIALWVAPGAWSWMIGSVLERHFAGRKPALATSAGSAPVAAPSPHP